MEKVIKYHKQFYTTNNMCIIVIGTVDYEKLKLLIDNIPVANEISTSIERPWVEHTEIEKFKEKIESFKFPSEEEDTGEVCISFHGKNHNDVMSHLQYKVLLEYEYI